MIRCVLNTSQLRGALLLVIVMVSSHPLHAQTAGEGREFILTLPYLSPSLNGGSETFRLYLSSESGAQVRLTLMETGVVSNTFVPSNGSTEILFDTVDLALPRAEGLDRRSLLVEATAPITVAVVLDRGTASEAYAGIPSDMLGYEYRAIAYPSAGEGTFVVVAAIEDGTTVTMTPSVETRAGVPAGTPMTVTLERGQVYQMLSLERFEPAINDDLTGTRVVADRPVAVWSGTTCALPPVGNSTCGPLIEQLPSIEQLGRDHPFALFPEEPRTIWRAVSPCADTRLIGSDLIPVVDTTLPAAPGFLEGETFTNGRFLSDESILLAHIGVNISTPPHNQSQPIGDPTMSIVVPVEGMARRHIVIIPFLPSRADGGGGVSWKHFISVTRANLTTNATIDGVPVTFVGLVGEQNVGAGMSIVIGDQPIAVTALGRSVSDAYAYVPGGIDRRLPLLIDTIRGLICGEIYDTTVSVVNNSVGDITIDSASFLNGLSGEIVTPLPLTIPASSQGVLSIRLRGVKSGSREGRIVLTTGACTIRVGVIRVDLHADVIDGIPSFGSLIRFRPIPRFIGSVDTVVRVINRNAYAITIDRFGSTHPAFTMIAPPLPMILPPFSEANVTLRFMPAPEDTIVDGRLYFFNSRCPFDSSLVYDLQGEVTLIDVFPPSIPLIFCDPKEPGEMTAIFVYNGSEPLTVSDAILVGDASEFTLLDPITTSRILLERDTLSLRIRFTPISLGLRSATLRIVTDRPGYDTIDIPIRFENERIDYRIDRDRIDFGSVECDSAYSQEINVTNVGTRTIDGLTAGMRIGDGFTVTNSGVDQIPPGGTARITVTPSGLPGRRYLDTLLIREPICGIEKRIPFSYGCIARGELRIGFVEEQGRIGELRSIPLRIERGAFPFIDGAPFELMLRVRMTADVLLPREPYLIPSNGVQFESSSSTIVGTDRILEFRLSGTFPISDTLALLPMLVLLGSDTLTELAIDSIDFRFLHDLHEGSITPFDGRLVVHGFCPIGGDRLVTTGDPLALKISPNPSLDDVGLDLQLVEDGLTTLVLSTLTGEIVRVLLDRPMMHGRWRIALSVNDLPAGHYIASLQTPTGSISVPLRIVD